MRKHDPAAPDAPAPPPDERLHELLALAKAGNMRAIHRFAEELGAEAPESAAFAERVKSLASAYQSRAILDLVSRHIDARKAA